MSGYDTGPIRLGSAGAVLICMSAGFIDQASGQTAGLSALDLQKQFASAPSTQSINSLNTTQAAALAGAIQSGGGDASGAVVSAAGGGTPRTLASLSADEIGVGLVAAAALPATGGTMTGPLASNAAIGATASGSAIIMKNSFHGSGVNGPVTAQHGINAACTKTGFFQGSTSGGVYTAAAATGEIDCLNIVQRQDGANSDGSGILVDAQTLVGSGFVSATEFHTSRVDPVANAYTQNMDSQELAIASDGTAYGHVLTALNGTLRDAINIQQQGGTWTYLLDTSNSAGTWLARIDGAGDFLSNTGYMSAASFRLPADSNNMTPALTTSPAKPGIQVNTALSAAALYAGGTFTAATDTTNGNVRIGNAAATTTPYLDFAGWGSAQSVRVVNDGANQLSILSGTGRNYVFGPASAAFAQPLTLQSDLVVGGSARIAGGTVSSQSASRTLSIPDCGTTIRDTGTSPHTYTIPAGLPLGCQVDVIQAGSGGTIAFAAGSGQVLEQAGSGTPSNTTTGRYAKATITIDSGSSFLLSGGVQ